MNSTTAFCSGVSPALKAMTSSTSFFNCSEPTVGGGPVADALRRPRVGRVVFRVEPARAHLRLNPVGVFGEEVHHRAVGGEADGLRLIGLGALGGGAAQLAAEARADRLLVVGRP